MMARAQQLDDQKQQAVQAAAGEKDRPESLFRSRLGPSSPARPTPRPRCGNSTITTAPIGRASLPAVKKFYDAHKNDTRFSFIEFPIRQLHGESAVLAAKASLAARRQPANYMDFHFALLGQEGSITDQIIYAEGRQGRHGCEQALKADMADPGIEKALAIQHRPGPQGGCGRHSDLCAERPRCVPARWMTRRWHRR